MTARWLLVVAYAGLAALLTRGGPTPADLWVLTLVGSFCVVFILAADWIAGGSR